MINLDALPRVTLYARRTRRWLIDRRVWPLGLIVAGVLVAALVLGRRPSSTVLIGLATLVGGATLLRYPVLGFPALIAAALMLRTEIGTGTEVSLNVAALLVPTLLVIWILTSLRTHDLRLVPSRTNRPLIVFILSGILSLLIGNAIWDPTVPRSDRFIIVQLAQLALFWFSAGIYWLIANRVKDVRTLQMLTAFYLLIAGGLAIIHVSPGGGYVTDQIGTFALDRAPFWLLLSSMAAGQLLFNRKLSTQWRLLLIAMLIAVFMYSFGQEQDRSSNWAGVAASLGMLIWLRFPRIRWPVITIVAVLAASGVLFRAIYDFAGGDAKWTESGASRGVLIQRVIELSMRNPITGIGPAAYRPYGFTKPLFYDGAYWIEPRINSHNNYVDLFSQLGVVGLLIFFWFMAEVGWLGRRLRKAFKDDFASGYVNSMLGMWAGTFVIMALADWFLPFVYNIGFPGFQASVLMWLFLGGLVVLEQIARNQTPSTDTLVSARSSVGDGR